jgi:hypothetical protein
MVRTCQGVHQAGLIGLLEKMLGRWWPQLSKQDTEREALKVRLAAATEPSSLTADQIAALLQQVGGISGMLPEATPEERADIYGALGIMLVHDDRTHQVRVTADLSPVVVRVGGGTCELPPHHGVGALWRPRRVSARWSEFRKGRCRRTAYPFDVRARKYL